MRFAKHLSIVLFFLLFCLPRVAAQSASAPTAAAQAPQPSAEVTITIERERVRFSARRAVAELRLQVFNQSGEPIYDSGAVSAAELDWPLQAGDGAALKSGLYAYTLTVRASGVQANDAEVVRTRRGHLILDRAQDRNGRTDKVWVTGRAEDSELTVATNESSTIAGTTVAGEHTLAVRGESPARNTDGRAVTAEKNEANKTFSPTSVASTPNRLAKFTGGNNELGDSVVSEVGGNIGIGTTAPANKLDVNGGIRAFFNSSTGMVAETTGGTNAWARFHMNTPSQRWFMGTSNNFNGNQFYLWDETFNQGRLTIQPNGGEVAFPSPVSNHVAIRTSGGTNSWAQLRLHTTNQAWMLGSSQNFNGDQFYLVDLTRNQQRMTIQPDAGAIAFPSGNFGIGTTNPATKLHVESPGYAELTLKSTNERAILALTNTLGPAGYTWTVESGVRGLPGVFGIFNRTVNRAGLEIDGNLLVSVKALQITGGADFAENFDVRAEAAAIQPGMVVAIDPADPGKLRLSRHAYDRRVAGIISGAGDVKPGMMMGAAGTLADGQHPVALSGRVYVWADATRGAIRPGDLLTTSSKPGHAMRAGNAAKAQGAIIGKAMTALRSGRGLVLVLVTLQ